MGELMNGLLRQRLVGLAVLLAATFLLSLLLPGTPQPSEAEPTTTVSITGEEQLTEADAVPPPDDMLPEPVDGSLPTVEPSVAIADVEAAAELPPAAPVPAVTPVPAPTTVHPAEGPKTAPKIGIHRAQDVVEPRPSAKPKPAEITPPPAPKPAETAPKPKLAESAPVPPKSAAPAAGWYVQIGSFSDAGSAETIVTLLKKLDVKAAITRITGVNGKPLNRVRAGPFASEAAAKAAHDKIARNGYPQARIVQESGR